MDSSTGRKFIHAPSYTTEVFDSTSFSKLVKRVAKIVKLLIKQHGKLHLAATGMSGIPLTAAVAARLKLPMLLIRPQKHVAHDSRMVNGTFDFTIGPKYLIIDDLVDSGATVRRVIAEITAAVARLRQPGPEHVRDCTPDFECVGILLYSTSMGWGGSCDGFGFPPNTKMYDLHPKPTGMLSP